MFAIQYAFQFLMIVVDRCGIVVDRCGSLWIVVDRCGSLWIVVGHCGSFRVLVTTERKRCRVEHTERGWFKLSLVVSAGALMHS